ncbi:Plant organelle RNA recognition domain containing protein [Parasponia andersonii]|uniref:Plant organelle RNA recognition domain containing protein n=1 Tax=Parasponia andersonii TaxID=3476 RepID=A0A2P5DV53_PARAD|nr:Plant organelle RNA recognition domain containing protein [Parasponia andersonii]
MAVIEKYPSIFFVGGGNRAPPFLRLTEKAERIAREEANAKELMEPILVRNIRKLLMLSVDCRVPLGKIKLIESELGFPDDFDKSLIPKYPEFFSAFNISFPSGFRPNMSYLEQFEKWQKMEFPSPYLNARRFEMADPKARKKEVAVLHELLSLTMEK